jgi:anti-sigma factor RsiW
VKVPLRSLLGRRRRRDALVCQQAVELMSDYLEDTLPAGDRARFEVHLAACEPCLLYLEQMRVTVAALGHLEPDALDDVVKDGLIQLYRRYQSR